MTKPKPITFSEMRNLLVGIGYRHEPAPRGEIFHMSEHREIYFRRYGEHEEVAPRDIVKTRGFLDDWSQLDAADFDAFLESTTKPA